MAELSDFFFSMRKDRLINFCNGGMPPSRGGSRTTRSPRVKVTRPATVPNTPPHSARHRHQRSCSHRCSSIQKRNLHSNGKRNIDDKFIRLKGKTRDKDRKRSTEKHRLQRRIHTYRRALKTAGDILGLHAASSPANTPAMSRPSTSLSVISSLTSITVPAPPSAAKLSIKTSPSTHHGQKHDNLSSETRYLSLDTPKQNTHNESTFPISKESNIYIEQDSLISSYETVISVQADRIRELEQKLERLQMAARHNSSDKSSDARSNINHRRFDKNLSQGRSILDTESPGKRASEMLQRFRQHLENDKSFDYSALPSFAHTQPMKTWHEQVEDLMKKGSRDAQKRKTTKRRQRRRRLALLKKVEVLITEMDANSKRDRLVMEVLSHFKQDLIQASEELQTLEQDLTTSHRMCALLKGKAVDLLSTRQKLTHALKAARRSIKQLKSDKNNVEKDNHTSSSSTNVNVNMKTNGPVIQQWGAPELEIPRFTATSLETGSPLPIKPGIFERKRNKIIKELHALEPKFRAGGDELLANRRDELMAERENKPWPPPSEEDVLYDKLWAGDSPLTSTIADQIEKKAAFTQSVSNSPGSGSLLKFDDSGNARAAGRTKSDGVSCSNEIPFPQPHKRSVHRWMKEILQVISRIGFEMDHETLLDICIDSIARLLGAERCSIFFVDSVRNELWTKAGVGLRTQIRVKMGVGIAGSVAMTGKPVNLANVGTRKKKTGVKSIDESNAFVTKSVVCVPLIAPTRGVFGVIQALNKVGGGCFNQIDQISLTVVAHYLSQALWASEIHEMCVREKLKTMGVFRAGQALMGCEDFAKFVATLNDRMRHFIEADYSIIFAVDHDLEELWLLGQSTTANMLLQIPKGHVYTGTKFSSIVPTRVPFNAGTLATHVAQTGEVINFKDAQFEPRFQHDIDEYIAQIRSKKGLCSRGLLISPIFHEHGTVCAVQVFGRTSTQPFVQYEVQVLEEFQDIIATAVKNLRISWNRQHKILKSVESTQNLIKELEHREQNAQAVYKNIVTERLATALPETARYGSTLADAMYISGDLTSDFEMSDSSESSANNEPLHTLEEEEEVEFDPFNFEKHKIETAVLTQRKAYTYDEDDSDSVHSLDSEPQEVSISAICDYGVVIVSSMLPLFVLSMVLMYLVFSYSPQSQSV